MSPVSCSFCTKFFLELISHSLLNSAWRSFVSSFILLLCNPSCRFFPPSLCPLMEPCWKSSLQKQYQIRRFVWKSLCSVRAPRTLNFFIISCQSSGHWLGKSRASRSLLLWLIVIYCCATACTTITVSWQCRLHRTYIVNLYASMYLKVCGCHLL